MTKSEIELVLRKHKQWLEGKPNGERANLNGENLACLSLPEVDFERAILRNCSFEFSVLCYANFVHADVQNCNFYGANLYHALFHWANLKNANLNGANVTEAVFTESRRDDVRGFF